MITIVYQISLCVISESCDYLSVKQVYEHKVLRLELYHL
jgi:hypothetical protein